MMKKHLFLILLLVFSGCDRQAGRNEKRHLADSLLMLPAGSIFTEPDRSDSLLAEAQQGLTDSILFYRLELLRSFSDYVKARPAAYSARHRKVERYCRNNPGTELLDGFRLNNRGVVSLLTGNREAAALFLDSAYHRMSEGHGGEEMIPVCINLADTHFQQGKLPEAAGYYRRALFVSDSLQADHSLIAINTGLGQVYTALRNFPEAHRYFDTVRKRIDRASTYEKYHYYNSLGNCFYAERRYREALAAFREALIICRTMKNSSEERLVSGNIGEIYLKLGCYDSAAVYLERVASTLTSGTDEAMRFYVNSLMAELALCRHDMKKASFYLEQPYDTASLGPNYLALHYRRLYDYYEQQGAWKQANYCLKQAVWYEDSLRNGQVMSYIAETSERYAQDTTLLHHNLSLAVYRSRVAKQQSYIAWGGAAICLLGLGTLLLVFHYRREDARRYAEHWATVTRLRMSIVRNRVSPHFVFNVLGTVLPRFRETPELEQPMNMLVDVLRDSLIFSERHTISLSEEITLVRHFTGLNAATHPSAPRIEWDIDSGTDMEQPVPVMCLQIPVENALKHAFPSAGAEDACIRISAVTRQGTLHLSVTDNGQGYCPGRVRSSERDTGTGLRLLARTAELLNQRNARKMSLTIRNRSDVSGTVVSLSIPQGYDFELPSDGFAALNKKER